jgi:hypothetical protein
MRRYDVIRTGRVGVDLYPQQIGVPLAAVELANAAGAPAASGLACADDFGTPEEIESVRNASLRLPA